MIALYHPMEKCCVVLVVQEWVMKEILVVSHVILVMTSLVVLLERVNLMDNGAILKLCAQGVC